MSPYVLLTYEVPDNGNNLQKKIFANCLLFQIHEENIREW